MQVIEVFDYKTNKMVFVNESDLGSAIRYEQSEFYNNETNTVIRIIPNSGEESGRMGVRTGYVPSGAFIDTRIDYSDSGDDAFFRQLLACASGIIILSFLFVYSTVKYYSNTLPDLNIPSLDSLKKGTSDYKLNYRLHRLHTSACFVEENLYDKEALDSELLKYHPIQIEDLVSYIKDNLDKAWFYRKDLWCKMLEVVKSYKEQVDFNYLIENKVPEMATIVMENIENTDHAKNELLKYDAVQLRSLAFYMSDRGQSSKVVWDCLGEVVARQELGLNWKQVSGIFLIEDDSIYKGSSPHQQFLCKSCLFIINNCDNPTVLKLYFKSTDSNLIGEIYSFAAYNQVSVGGGAAFYDWLQVTEVIEKYVGKDNLHQAPKENFNSKSR